MNPSHLEDIPLCDLGRLLSTKVWAGFGVGTGRPSHLSLDVVLGCFSQCPDGGTNHPPPQFGPAVRYCVYVGLDTGQDRDGLGYLGRGRPSHAGFCGAPDAGTIIRCIYFGPCCMRSLLLGAALDPVLDGFDLLGRERGRALGHRGLLGAVDELEKEAVFCVTGDDRGAAAAAGHYALVG
jgi:hypothetical protein